MKFDYNCNLPFNALSGPMLDFVVVTLSLSILINTCHYCTVLVNNDKIAMALCMVVS